MYKRTSTIIVDDHTAFRRTLRRLLQTLDSVEVVDEAGDGQQALDLTVKLRPQLVLMDICMPWMNGTDSCRAMKRDNAELSVVLYSADSLEIELAVAQGVADLCLTKECLFDELPTWIGDTFSQRQVWSGKLQTRDWLLVTRWQQTVSGVIARETNSCWLRPELGGAN